MAPRGRIVFTASEVHDPESPGGAVGPGATLGDLSGLREAAASGGGAFTMVDGGEWDADKAYKDSKLCNVLTCRELARRLKEAGSNVTATAFGPGLITETSFFSNNQYQSAGAMGAFDLFADKLFKVTETREGGGKLMEYMALSPELDGVSGQYYNNALAGYNAHAFEQQPGSVESRDAAEAAALWELSAKLVGVSPELVLDDGGGPDAAAKEAAMAMVVM